LSSLDAATDTPNRGVFRADHHEDEFIACQRLAEALLPPHRLRVLLDFAGGSPREALAISPTELRGPRLALTEKQVIRLAEAKIAPLPPRFLSHAAALGAHAVTFHAPQFPQNLLPLSDAPPLLFVRGTLNGENDASLAIVGSRRATGYGRGQAERFAREFVENGLTVVSGGASGIDSAAHAGALSAGGRTIAVLGCGVDVTYPAENRALFGDIVESGGALVSEFAMGTKPEPWRFPTRNRIIAGIARATVLIETPENSGALGTARSCADYGRDIWVVPGAVDTERSRGGHRLIQDGAGLADTPGDVLIALGVAAAPPADAPRPRVAKTSTATVTGGQTMLLPIDDGSNYDRAASMPPPTPRPLPDLSPGEAALCAQFAEGDAPRHLDEAATGANLAAADATVAATLLEMKGVLRRHPGNLFTRVR